MRIGVYQCQSKETISFSVTDRGWSEKIGADNETAHCIFKFVQCFR